VDALLLKSETLFDTLKCREPKLERDFAEPSSPQLGLVGS